MSLSSVALVFCVFPMSAKVVSWRSFLALPLLIYFSPAVWMYDCQLHCGGEFAVLCCWSMSVNALCHISLSLVLYSFVFLISVFLVHCFALLRSVVAVCNVTLSSLWSVCISVVLEVWVSRCVSLAMLLPMM